MKENDKENQFIFTSDRIDEINEKNNKGFKITRQEKFWLSNQNLVKKDGLVFSMTEEEELDYIRCKMGVDANNDPILTEDQEMVKTGIEYFSENFCKIKDEEGNIRIIKLRDYQQEILDLYMDNRFSVLAGSRQIGKCQSPDTQVVTKNGSVYVYELWYESLIEKTIYDKIKHFLYRLLSKL